MKRFYTICLMLIAALFAGKVGFAQQQEWPRQITTAGNDLVKIYQPQPESFSGNVLKYRSAIALIENGKTEPVFGTYWSTANTITDENKRTVAIQSLNISSIRFPGEVDESTTNDIQDALEKEIPGMNLQLSLDELNQSLQSSQEQAKLSSEFNNNPPKVIYTSKPSILVLIDGSPKLQMNNELGVETVVNSPFTIVKNTDGRFYLYGGKHWFSAPAATGPFTYTSNVPSNLSKIEEAVNKAAANNANSETNLGSNAIPSIIVSTEPAELIQSNGEANFSPVEATSLLYVKNSANDIFMDTNSQQYYVLLSGRWYRSASLNSKWDYIAADKLPADFAKIPEGSSKDNVLASVAGTDAASEAIMDAQVPQTAKVDRKSATVNVTYDGDPEFDKIDGTNLKYAVNASTTILKVRNSYYAVDNGIWFQSSNPAGPWIVSTTRPDEVDMIPPSYPVYNTKYVYIYDVTPDYVYMGYTPGYLNTYIYGPTIVYGTGYHYRPWYGRYYFPRPWSWGFGMGYNPWTGWGMGFGFSYGWFNFGFSSMPYSYYGGGYYGGGYGWWGPSMYYPAHCAVPYRSYGYYGNNYYRSRSNVNININYTNNVYRYRSNVVTRNNQRPAPNYNRGGNNNRSWLADNNRSSWNNRNADRNPDRNRNYNNNNSGPAYRPGRDMGGRPDRSANLPGSGSNDNSNGNNRNRRPFGNNVDRPSSQNPQGSGITPDRNNNRPYSNGNRVARPNNIPGSSADVPQRNRSLFPDNNGRPQRPAYDRPDNTNRNSYPNRNSGQTQQRDYAPQRGPSFDRQPNNNRSFDRPQQQMQPREPQRRSDIGGGGRGEQRSGGSNQHSGGGNGGGGERGGGGGRRGHS